MTRLRKSTRPGCWQQSAVNYNPRSTWDGGDAACIFVVYGCTDPHDIAFDPNATVSYPELCESVYGCMDVNASNYDRFANTPFPSDWDEECEYVRPLPPPPLFFARTLSPQRAPARSSPASISPPPLAPLGISLDLIKSPAISRHGRLGAPTPTRSTTTRRRSTRMTRASSTTFAATPTRPTTGRHKRSPRRCATSTSSRASAL